MKPFNSYVFSAALALTGLLAPHTLNPAESAAHSASAQHKDLTAFEAELLRMGFVDVQALDPEIRVELKYASDENFMRSALYEDIGKAYLRRDAAVKLARANKYLKELRPELTLVVGDALRPRKVSRQMWSRLSGTREQRYVANPAGGSMHNYGCAVDVTISDHEGNRLDMGTPMDHFGALAQPRYERKFLQAGRLTKEQVANRGLLRKVMNAAGFRGIPIEWWHFEAFDKKFIRANYSIIE